MQTYDNYLAIVNRSVERLDLPSSPAGLYDPIRYALSAGGKRIRPVLTLAACEAFDRDPLTAIHQAIAIEMFHNFTLLHDDVMDRADVRRGLPTVNRKWNDTTAILSGDAMLTTATMLLAIHADHRLAPALDLFNATTMNIYEGQQYDMDFESRTDVTLAEYMEMIRLKTSVLLGCACAMGALMADVNLEMQQRFFKYGENLGLAFQLRDDYLDTFGDPATFGKNIGGDILNDKKTWLLINALIEDKSGTLRAMLGKTDYPEEKIAIFRKIYNELNLPQRINAAIDGHIADAISQLDEIGLRPEAYAFFEKLALKTAGREK